ncbi:DUF503 domain-containing protein [candidate division KSB1 bacterium]|nr:DUF503 domain-containing protein [candidate division KSB1 bacterium]NIR70419.1 DUF503 domain-containing protein [candidate division KSB1 bacterium]NIS25959.1 DUF503 domain-containing protein [candidate division KSB1 bacterium]NIT69982.1 DUF503 domain-containing protein [candidate division KSB1 bacterium]NIU26647.1 DUF503 domain-containing protein [candidate division KSB1 bacterium]
MLVGVCRIDLFIPDSGSLKSKRTILKSIKQKIRNRFNVSVNEIEPNNKWQRMSLGISMVTNERKFIDMTMSEILKLINGDTRLELLNHIIEVY